MSGRWVRRAQWHAPHLRRDVAIRGSSQSRSVYARLSLIPSQWTGHPAGTEPKFVDEDAFGSGPTGRTMVQSYWRHVSGKSVTPTRAAGETLRTLVTTQAWRDERIRQTLEYEAAVQAGGEFEFEWHSGGEEEQREY